MVESSDSEDATYDDKDLISKNDDDCTGLEMNQGSGDLVSFNRDSDNGFFSSSMAMDMLNEEIRKALAYVEDGAIQRMTKIFISPTNPFCMAATSAIGVVALQTAWLSSTYTPLPLPKQDRSHGYVRYSKCCAHRRPSPFGSSTSCGVGMRISKCPDSGEIHIRDLALGGSAAQSGRLRPWDRIIAVPFLLSRCPAPFSTIVFDSPFSASERCARTAQVDGRPVTGLAAAAVGEIIAGPPNTTVNLLVERPPAISSHV